MKTLLALLLLLSLYSHNLFSNEINDKCLKMAESAKTSNGFSTMFNVCKRELQNPESSVFNRSKMFKCAKKAFKKKTDEAVNVTYMLCMDKKK